VNHCDSSETSSVASEISQGQECREREHYNKLKVDVRQAQGNKKLLKGVKILQEENNLNAGLYGVAKLSPHSPSKTAAGMDYLHTHKSPSRVVASMDHLHPSHISPGKATAGVDYSHPSHNSPAKYRKEGHTNQLHSVLRTFHSLRQPAKPLSLLPKSKSTGDIMRLSRDKSTGDGMHARDAAQVSYNIRRHQLTHSRSTHNIESATESCSMSTSNSSYSIGRAAGVSVHSPAPSSSDEVHTPGSAEMPFINKMIRFTCGHEGREITSTAYDFSVKISKGTVRKRKSIAFNVGVCLYGPFSFPTGYKLVSPILMVTSATHHKLKRPIEVVLSHCTDIAANNEAVTFFRAKVRGVTSPPHSYQFEPTDTGSNHFEKHSTHGKLSSSELGFFCIMAKETAGTRRKTNYCLVPVVPRNIDSSSSWTVHYCLTLHLQAFINVSE
jgi:hypothetical protein